MGTQGTVRVYEGDTEILRFYAQSDGYPDGLGKDVADFCATRRIVNGISSRYRQNAIANGAGCLAGLLLAHFKDGVGSIYVTSPHGEVPKWSYEYRVKCPGFKEVDAADRADPRGFQGLPIVVEAFDCGEQRARIEIPDDEPAAESSGDTDDPEARGFGRGGV